jgi:hypothetical protein
VHGGLRPVTGERDRRKAPESIPLGWSSRGLAVVHVLEGLCGNGYPVTGIYLIDPATGKHSLVYATRRSSAFMWHR